MVECAGRMWRVIRGKGEGERSRMRIDEEEEMKSERKDFSISSTNIYIRNDWISRKKRDKKGLFKDGKRINERRKRKHLCNEVLERSNPA